MAITHNLLQGSGLSRLVQQFQIRAAASRLPSVTSKRSTDSRAQNGRAAGMHTSLVLHGRPDLTCHCTRVWPGRADLPHGRASPPRTWMAPFAGLSLGLPAVKPGGVVPASAQASDQSLHKGPMPGVFQVLLWLFMQASSAETEELCRVLCVPGTRAILGLLRSAPSDS